MSIIPFDATDLSNMRTAQTGHMQDSCYIQALTSSVDSFGQPVRSWADTGSELACGLDMRPGSETRKPDLTVVKYDGVIRLGITTTVDETQKIRVTKRFGEALSVPLIYNIVSPIQRGPSGFRILVERVST